MRKLLSLILSLLAIAVNSLAQVSEDEPSKPSDFVLRGYVKYLEQLYSSPLTAKIASNQLVHNRLNLAYLPGTKFKFRLEVRNRLYFGELVRDYPGFSDQVTAGPGLVNLSENWINKSGILLNSTIDRASAEYINNKWDIIIGRQRINWGVNSVWTPNDIFNSFNFFDFDYEERPGTDAVRVKYEISGPATLEADYAPGRKQSEQTGAVMMHYNRWTYDFQLFTGIYHTDRTAGIGWAGNLGKAGFKGEATLFSPTWQNSGPNTWTSSLSVDYGFRNGIYLLVSGLYNKLGSDTTFSLLQLQGEALNAKNLFPFRYTGFVQCAWPVSPLIRLSLGAMYAPTGNTLILLPDCSWAVSSNWALDLVAQIFATQQANTYTSPVGSYYVRLKWGF